MYESKHPIITILHPNRESFEMKSYLLQLIGKTLLGKLIEHVVQLICRLIYIRKNIPNFVCSIHLVIKNIFSLVARVTTAKLIVQNNSNNND